MSRIGRKPVPVPSGVSIDIAKGSIIIRGPRGELSQQFPASIEIKQDNGTLMVTRASDEPSDRSLHGLVRSLVANMVTGVTAGFTKTLLISGVGYRAVKEGDNLRLSVGYSHPVEIMAPDGVTFEVPVPTRIIISGYDKQLVGEVAAKIRSVRPPEPYLGKGIRYDVEIIRRKAGKAGKVGAK
jgi:large subunit ribosomal protein L6